MRSSPDQTDRTLLIKVFTIHFQLLINPLWLFLLTALFEGGRGSTAGENQSLVLEPSPPPPTSAVSTNDRVAKESRG